MMPDLAAAAEEAARKLNPINTWCYAALHLWLLAICKHDDSLLRERSLLMVDLSAEYGLAFWKTFGELGLTLMRCRADDPHPLDWRCSWM